MNSSAGAGNYRRGDTKAERVSKNNLQLSNVFYLFILFYVYMYYIDSDEDIFITQLNVTYSNRPFGT